MPAARFMIATVAMALWAAAGPARDAEMPATRTVVIEDMKFTPQTLTVQRGERVMWINKDLFAHTATAAAFDSRAIASGASWVLVASGRGKYPYACALHPGMKATVIVQ